MVVNLRDAVYSCHFHLSVRVCLRDTAGSRSDVTFESVVRNVVAPSEKSRNARLQKMSTKLPA